MAGVTGYWTLAASQLTQRYADRQTKQMTPFYYLTYSVSPPDSSHIHQLKAITCLIEMYVSDSAEWVLLC